MLYVFDFTACRPGYSGILCDTPCPFGGFGRNCAGKYYQISSDEECDNVNGYFQKTMNTIKPRNTGILNHYIRIFFSQFNIFFLTLLMHYDLYPINVQ